MQWISPDRAPDTAYEVELARVRARLDEMLKEKGVRFGAAGATAAARERKRAIGIVIGMAATAALMLIAAYCHGAAASNR